MWKIKERIARRAAQEIEPHTITNLGIGIPTLVVKYLEADHYDFHTENGLLGLTDLQGDEIDPFIVNAGKQPVGETIAASYFHSADSFAMIRGGHVDAAVLGALQVDSKGRVANWSIPEKNIIGVGGAMDLLVGAKKVIITTLHTSKDGTPKIVEECTYPISSTRPADMIITELAVFTWKGDFYELTEVQGDTTLEEIKEKTKAFYKIGEKLK